MSYLIDPKERKEELEEKMSQIAQRKMEQVIPQGAGSDPSIDERAEEADVLKLWGHWREIARLAALGLKQQEICKVLNLSTSCVWNALNRNPLVKQRIAYLQGKRDEQTIDVTKRIKALQPVALDVLELTLLDESGKVSPKLKVDVAKTVLDRGGNGAVIRSENFSTVLTMKDLKEIHERAAQVRGEEVEEIDYEEVS